MKFKQITSAQIFLYIYYSTSSHKEAFIGLPKLIDKAKPPSTYTQLSLKKNAR